MMGSMVLLPLFWCFFLKDTLLYFSPSEIPLGVLHPLSLERHEEADFLACLFPQLFSLMVPRYSFRTRGVHLSVVSNMQHQDVILGLGIL